MDSYVKVEVDGLDKLIEGLSSKKYVDVGIVEPTSKYDNGMTVASVGLIHEFGSDAAGRDGLSKIPERSFIRMPLETGIEFIMNEAGKNLIKNLSEGKVNKILEDIGHQATVQIEKAFLTGGHGEWTKLAQSTRDRKGSDAILLDTEKLANSISYKVGGGK